MNDIRHLRDSDLDDYFGSHAAHVRKQKDGTTQSYKPKAGQYTGKKVVVTRKAGVFHTTKWHKEMGETT